MTQDTFYDSKLAVQTSNEIEYYLYLAENHYYKHYLELTFENNQLVAEVC